MIKKSIPSSVFAIIMFVLSGLSIIAFFSPLVIGLLVYYNVADIGQSCATFFVEKIGFDPSSALPSKGITEALERYYVSLYQLIGLAIFTFVPLSVYGLIFAIGSICSLFGIDLDEGEGWSAIATILSALFAIALAIVYWWAICQKIGYGDATIMSYSGKPMHWGYRFMFYIFPLLSIAIQFVAIFIGAMIAEHLGMEDIPLLFPLFSLLGVAIGGGLVGLMFFAFVKILIFIASIAGFLIIVGAIISVFSPSQAYYTDSTGTSRKYHETFFKDAYIDENDADSWKNYNGD
ncbi:MAG TPA: hypothetical protein DD377_04060 [Firmicutes bacterium]|nr:hypothetical protein [Bacillota bacterium]HBM70521.1 hypothetical protein [Bacillota bacterium]